MLKEEAPLLFTYSTEPQLRWADAVIDTSKKSIIKGLMYID
jgi:hypothetical protein